MNLNDPKRLEASERLDKSFIRLEHVAQRLREQDRLGFMTNMTLAICGGGGAC